MGTSITKSKKGSLSLSLDGPKTVPTMSDEGRCQINPLVIDATHIKSAYVCYLHTHTHTHWSKGNSQSLTRFEQALCIDMCESSNTMWPTSTEMHEMITIIF